MACELKWVQSDDVQFNANLSKPQFRTYYI